MKHNFQVKELSCSGQISDVIYESKDLLSRISGVHRAGRTSSATGYGPVPIQSRDLNRLDFSYTLSEESAILIRKNAVIISFHPIRAIVTSDRLIIIQKDELDPVADLITDQIKLFRENGRQLDFEMDAYDAIFATTLEIQKLEIQRLQKIAKRLFTAHKKFTIPPLSLQEETILLRRKVSDRLEHVRGQRTALQEILNDDQLLTLMNLTYLRDHSSDTVLEENASTIDIHTSVEEFLVSHLLEYNSLTSQLNLLLSSLQETIQHIALRLDTAQNQIQICDAVLGVAISTVLFMLYVPTLAGMNLKFSIHTGFEIFFSAIIFSFGAGAVFLSISLLSLRVMGVL